MEVRLFNLLNNLANATDVDGREPQSILHSIGAVELALLELKRRVADCYSDIREPEANEVVANFLSVSAIGVLAAWDEWERRARGADDDTFVSIDDGPLLKEVAAMAREIASDHPGDAEARVATEAVKTGCGAEMARESLKTGSGGDHDRLQMVSLARTIRSMRATQGLYFRVARKHGVSQDRKQRILVEAKQLESTVDKMVAAILGQDEYDQIGEEVSDGE